jgi:hypothetical protein
VSINIYPAKAAADPWIEQAKRIILADYGVNVSLEAKNKNLLKFGHNPDVQTSSTTLMKLPSGVYNETYVSTNIITSIISTAAGDTEEVVIEGHTISGGVFTFVTQTKSLTGTTAVTLDTPLARVSRVYNNDVTELTGTISVCQNDTYTAGVPQTSTGVHAQIQAGFQQTQKCSTTLSNSDYWVITSFYADMIEKAATSADVGLEVRLAGKVFRQVADVSCSESHRANFQFKPYLIVPPNSDVRLRARASANGKDVSGGMEGTLLKA